MHGYSSIISVFANGTCHTKLARRQLTQLQLGRLLLLTPIELHRDGITRLFIEEDIAQGRDTPYFGIIKLHDGIILFETSFRCRSIGLGRDNQNTMMSWKIVLLSEMCIDRYAAYI